jgi:hypothetical protein
MESSGGGTIELKRQFEEFKQQDVTRQHIAEVRAHRLATTRAQSKMGWRHLLTSSMISKIDQVQSLIEQVADLEARLHRAQSDLEDQNEIRAKWKALAEKAEDAQVSLSFPLPTSKKFQGAMASTKVTPSTTLLQLLWPCGPRQLVQLHLQN